MRSSSSNFGDPYRRDKRLPGPGDHQLHIHPQAAIDLGIEDGDYVYVDDVVSALVAAATAPNINGLVINVGSGTETSIKDLIKSVLDVTGGKAEVIFNAQTSGGVSRMRADLTLANQKLNYRPSISLLEGLRLTLKRDPRFS